MKQYHDLLRDILENGIDSDDRTNTGTLSVFGRQNRYNLQEGFPIITTKRVHFKSVFWELIWMLRGDTNVKWLQDRGVTIWDEWAREDGTIGPGYGKQWRNFGQKFLFTDNACIQINAGMTDQIATVIYQIQNNPNSRRIIFTGWNPTQIEEMALPPCHAFTQFYVRDGKLSCHMYQRSADVFLGVPFNIAQYALLTHLFANLCDLEVGDFVHSFGDVHIYKNHIDQVKIQLDREPYPLPTLNIKKHLKTLEDIEELQLDDVELVNYQHHSTIKAKVAV